MIRRQGGFVPGVRPGISTTNYLSHIISRITLPGSVFLASVAVLPSIASAIWDIPLGFSGISILITDHNYFLIDDILDKVYIMKQGQIITSGTTKQIEKDEKAIKYYLGQKISN